MPKLTHPDSKKSIEVSKEQVPMYLTQGWAVAAPASTKKTTATKKAAE